MAEEVYKSRTFFWPAYFGHQIEKPKYNPNLLKFRKPKDVPEPRPAFALGNYRHQGYGPYHNSTGYNAETFWAIPRPYGYGGQLTELGQYRPGYK